MNTLSAIEVLRYIAAIIKNSPLTKVVDVNGPAVAFLGPGSSTQSRLVYIQVVMSDGILPG